MLYHMRYHGSIDGTVLNPSLESNAMQAVVVYDTIYDHLTIEVTSSLFIYCAVLNQINKYLQTYILLKFSVHKDKIGFSKCRRTDRKRNLLVIGDSTYNIYESQ